PMYGKYVLNTKKYVAHDENNDCNIGDTVKIMETRPLSKSKRWRLVEILERAK
ncbi:MAG: 30S ribosomal protein S17, partial [Flavobacteriaceae bacterium]|nr:30S ribosomal protein S17 [Flavobacteriaceae bacterium]